MADIELDAATTAAYLDIVGDHRVIVISQLGGDVRIVLQLPAREPDRPAHRLAWELTRIADRVRAEARNDAHSGGMVIFVPQDMSNGGPASGAG